YIAIKLVRLLLRPQDVDLVLLGPDRPLDASERPGVDGLDQGVVCARGAGQGGQVPEAVTHLHQGDVVDDIGGGHTQVGKLQLVAIGSAGQVVELLQPGLQVV